MNSRSIKILVSTTLVSILGFTGIGEGLEPLCQALCPIFGLLFLLSLFVTSK